MEFKDPYQIRDPCAQNDPYGQKDPYALSDPYATKDPYANNDPYARKDPYFNPYNTKSNNVNKKLSFKEFVFFLVLIILVFTAYLFYF